MARKKHTPGDEPPQTINIEDARMAKAMAESAVQLAEFAAQVLVAADELGIKKKPLEHFWLAPAQREVLLAVPDISKSIKAKLTKEKASFTATEVASMVLVLAEASAEGDSRTQFAILLVARHLADRLQAGITGLGKSKTRKAKEPKTKAHPNTIFQFKITMLDTNPPIWRRIQVADCTLDKLHEHIQTAMGWTNSHLHQFEIKGKRYGDPELLDDDFEDFVCIDSTRTMLSKLLPKSGKRFAFTYEYDFGDDWQHEVLFEGSPSVDPKAKYPLCLEGERACPPEDCGGVWGYAEFLEARADPKHEQHEDFKEWHGSFDPEKFDAKRATKRMKQGLPDWRQM